jgi:hypothetical protein
VHAPSHNSPLIMVMQAADFRRRSGLGPKCQFMNVWVNFYDKNRRCRAG